ncbi:MAG TPA: tetratricopeptide repeat protein, partial [Polyangiaceae bacterium]|nr:tetratricopeptide repeat protein [Polyangiaceae bacterium]
MREQVFGVDHASCAQPLCNLAVADLNLGDFAAARQALERARRILKTTRGAKHPDYARTVGNLAELLRQTGAFREAEPLCLEAIRILEKDPNDIDYVTMRSNLALIYIDSGRHALARPILVECNRTLAEIGELRSAVSALVFNNLGTLEQRAGNLDQAETLFKASLKIEEDVAGKQNLRYATSLDNLGTVYAEKGRHRDALNAAGAAVAIYEKTVPDTHPDYLISLGHLARSYIALGNQTQAPKLIRRWVELCEKAVPRHDGVYGDALKALAEADFADGDTNQAIASLMKAIDAMEHSGSSSRRRRIESLELLTRLRVLTGDRQAAIAAADAAQRALAEDLGYTLPRLAEHRQMGYFNDTFVPAFHQALSLIADDETTAETSAAWVLNAKGIVSQVVGERAIRLRMVNFRDVVALRSELKEVRRQLAGASVTVAGQDVLPQLAKERSDRIAALAEKERSLADRLATLAHEVEHGGWEELGAVRENLPPTAVLVEYIRHVPYDFQARTWRPAEYLAWLIPAKDEGPVRVVR